MLNLKQKELGENLYNTLKRHFPDIQLVEIIENPSECGGILVRIIPPMDSQTRGQFYSSAGEMTTDIAVDYGCDILVTYAANSAKCVNC